MKRIFRRPTRVGMEIMLVYTGQCLYCKKALRRGQPTIVCRSKNGQIQARFCSEECQQEKERELLDSAVESEL